jgi:hypothetical protein
MKKLWNLIFCGVLVFAASPAFAADLSLGLGALPTTTTSVGALTIGATLVPASETSTGAPLAPGIQVSASQTYTYTSKCSYGGRYATWYTCTRTGTLSQSQIYRPFYLTNPLNLTVTFHNYNSPETLTSAPVLPQTGGFDYTDYTVTLEDQNGGIIWPNSGTISTYNLNKNSTQYKVVFNTTSKKLGFNAEGLTITLK